MTKNEKKKLKTITIIEIVNHVPFFPSSPMPYPGFGPHRPFLIIIIISVI
jgi:hypothetical protein